MSQGYNAETDDDEKGRSQGAIGGGLALIVLATVLNFVLDDMSPDEVAELPWFIALAFESRGKLGVTVVLCTIGVLLIVWGYISAPAEEVQTSGNRPSPKSPLPVPAAVESRPTQSGLTVTGTAPGTELATAKYLQPAPEQDAGETDTPPAHGIGPGGPPPEFRRGRIVSRQSD